MQEAVEYAAQCRVALCVFGLVAELAEGVEAEAFASVVPQIEDAADGGDYAGEADAPTQGAGYEELNVHGVTRL